MVGCQRMVQRPLLGIGVPLGWSVTARNQGNQAAPPSPQTVDAEHTLDALHLGSGEPEIAAGVEDVGVKDVGSAKYEENVLVVGSKLLVERLQLLRRCVVSHVERARIVVELQLADPHGSGDRGEHNAYQPSPRMGGDVGGKPVKHRALTQ